MEQTALSAQPESNARDMQQSPATEEPPAVPEIQTYHCLCNNLLLATTCNILSLPRRDASQDRALILPSPPVPRHLLTPSDEDASSDSEPEDAPTTVGIPQDVTVAVSLPRAPQPIVVRRSDGFEKRWLLRCGRCRLVVGYQLDGAQFAAKIEGRRDDVMYILPGALRSTADMAAGKKPSDEGFEFGLGVGDG